jgi:hypothetical protein
VISVHINWVVGIYISPLFIHVRLTNVVRERCVFRTVTMNSAVNAPGDGVDVIVLVRGGGVVLPSQQVYPPVTLKCLGTAFCVHCACCHGGQHSPCINGQHVPTWDNMHQGPLYKCAPMVCCHALTWDSPRGSC